MRTIDSDTASLIAGDFRASLTHALAFMRHLEHHKTELEPAIRRRLVDESVNLLEAFVAMQCEHCEAELITTQRGSQGLCEACNQLFAVCDACKDDVLISEAVIQDGPQIVNIYHPACAPQVQDA